MMTSMTTRGGKPINSKDIKLKQLRLKRNEKMAKTKNRIKKMTFQRQTRTITSPISDDDKYVIELAGYRKRQLVENTQHEKIPRLARGSL